MKLSLVVPCYNEEKNVPLFYEAVKNDFAGVDFDYELVFVNDGSSDGTLEELKKLCDGDLPVKIIIFSRNFGKESAMYAGLCQAEGDYVAIIDADLQQRPSVVLDMAKILDGEPEYDCAAAYLKSRKENKLISFCKKIFYKVINRLSDVEFVEGASDFRIFRRPVVEALISMKEYSRFSKGLFSWVGFNTKFIPYEVMERAKGASKWSFKKLFKYAMDGIFSFTTAPLRAATALGATAALASFICLIIIIVRAAAGLPVAELLSIAALALFLSGAQLICVGILGEYIARTYMQAKGRPIYIVRDVIKNRRYEK